jgi:hypothetical protein
VGRLLITAPDLEHQGKVIEGGTAHLILILGEVLVVVVLALTK